MALAALLLAVLLQINAPIQSLMMTLDRQDGVGAICTVHVDKGGTGQRAPAMRHDACAICALCHAGNTAVMTGNIVLALSTAQGLVVRAHCPAILNPRGPPLRAANARAPPAFA